jgi:ABC-type transport system involved in multi-copper enzyme maturation permease subunit
MTSAKAWSQKLSEQPWQLWLAQLLAVLRMELRKSFWSKRSFWIYFLALGPVVVIFAHGVTSPLGRNCSIEGDTRILAGIVQLYYVRLAIFFGCMGIFTWLFRGEMVERSLHYYFLAPIRRELLAIGKFFAGLITAVVAFGVGVTLSFYFMYSHFGAAGRYFVFSGPGLGHFWAYLAVTVLACFGYGAVFIALSLVFKNPIIPGALFLMWEGIVPVLPSALQKLSITFYLKQLYPVQLPADGLLALFTVVAQPVATWVAVLGLTILALAVLTFACFRIRTLEVNYGTDT